MHDPNTLRIDQDPPHFNAADHDGRLVLIHARGYRAGHMSTNGRLGTPFTYQIQTHAQVHILDGPGAPHVRNEDVIIVDPAIVAAIERRIDNPHSRLDLIDDPAGPALVGRLVKVEHDGAVPFWTLDDPTREEYDAAAMLLDSNLTDFLAWLADQEQKETSAMELFDLAEPIKNPFATPTATGLDLVRCILAARTRDELLALRKQAREWNGWTDTLDDIAHERYHEIRPTDEELAQDLRGIANDLSRLSDNMPDREMTHAMEHQYEHLFQLANELENVTR